MVSGEKRNNEEENFMEKITAILLDIEGTTTSVSFVKDTLFPYVKEHLESYVNSHWDDPEFKEDFKALKDQAKIDEEAKIEGFCPIDEEKESLVKNVLWQMSLDRKTTALKQLQGHIWREGYKNGKLKGHIYADVVPAMKRWREENRGIYIFSSGSVEAQKLLFGHSEEGDLSDYISGYYDTNIGPKNEGDSYSNIVESLGCEKEQILFLTDVAKEAEAARSAGMQVALVVRENNEPLTDDEKKTFMIITSFSDLMCENPAKRKKICDDSNEENNMDTENTEKETTNENGDKSQVNGNEEMDVDIANEESKSESNENDTEKTADKTEDENKAETDEIEIDVVNEDLKEQNAEVSTSNGDESAGPENGANSDGKEEDAKEAMDSEPQVDAADPVQVADPLEITKDENATEEKEAEPEKEEKENCEEQKNGTDDIENVEGQEEKPEPSADGEVKGEAEGEAETEAAAEGEADADGDVEGEAEAEAEGEAEAEAEAEGEGKGKDVLENADGKTDGNSAEETEGTNEKASFSEDKEMNGHDENSENNGVDEEIAINKIVPEDKPDPTVEVKA